MLRALVILAAILGSALLARAGEPPPQPSDLTIALQRAQMFESQATYLQSVLALREHQWSDYAKPLWDFPEQKPSAEK